MGGDTLVNRISGETIDEDHVNIFNRVLEGDFVGRDSSGAPTAGQNLGTATIPWGTARITDLILNGLPVDPGLITARPNRVISGAIRVTSDFPDYLRAAGSAASFTVLGLTTTLNIDVNGVTVEITTDIVKAGLTLAPATNNTCLINDTTLTGQDSSRFLGENGTGIPVDTMGSELTAKIGKFVALLNQTTSEIMYCRVASATRLDYARRGFCFDSSGNPVPAAGLTNNDVLQILSLGFIFAEDDGTTIDVTYRNPVVSGDQPSSPQVGDYWYDLAVNIWKRYNGVSFDQIDRTFIGAAVIDTANCVGTRPEYYTVAYKDDNTLTTILLNVNTVIASTADFLVSINGDERKFDFSFFQWAAGTDFESGFTRTIDRYYWIYITEDGKPIISGYKPYDVRGFLRGWYHPYESWRAVAQVYNNASNEFELVSASDATLEYLTGNLLLGRITLANNSLDAADIDFSGGSFTFDDGTGKANALPLTKQGDANWVEGNNQGGLDTGTPTGNTWYYCYAIYNPITKLTDYLFTKTFGSPTLPTGYTKKRYIGFVRSGTGVFLSFKQTEKYFMWDIFLNDITISYGAAPTTRTLYALTTPPIPSIKAILNLEMEMATGLPGARTLVLTDPNQSDQAPTFDAIFSLQLAQGTAENESVCAQFMIETDSSSQIGIRLDTANAQVTGSIIGCIDLNLED